MDEKEAEQLKDLILNFPEDGPQEEESDSDRQKKAEVMEEAFDAMVQDESQEGKQQDQEVMDQEREGKEQEHEAKEQEQKENIGARPYQV